MWWTVGFQRVREVLKNACVLQSCWTSGMGGRGHLGTLVLCFIDWSQYSGKNGRGVIYSDTIVSCTSQ